VLARESGIRVLAEAGTVRETLRSARLVPRILLLDAGLVFREGSALLPMFRQHSPTTKVIVLAGRTFGELPLPALALGAQGYLNRRLIRAFLPKAVRTVDSGEPWVSRSLLPRIIETLMRLGATPGPPRERP
jgi:DNA-binding NarL/FixJ family response regulator